MRRGKRVVIGKKQAIIIAALCLVLAMAAGITWHEFSLRNAQQGLVSLMEEEDGNYNENKVVLSSTTPKEANEMADAFGGKLRITENGKFAVITLPDGMTLSDIAANKDFRKYHDRILLDYNNFGARTEEIAAEDVAIENPEMDITAEDEAVMEDPEADVTAEENSAMKNPEVVTTSLEAMDAAVTDVPEDAGTGIRANYQVDDPMYPQQEYMDYLNIRNSWNATRGKKEDGTKVKVAVIDTGIDTDHPEFYDADGKSIISTKSYNATSDKTVEQNDISIIEDTDGHGTAVAGIIAAQMDDKGIAGLAPDTELLVVKCELNDRREFKSSSDIVFAIYYAIEQDADVINMSLGGTADRAIEEALQLAVDSDIITVAGAGNDGTAEPFYPAAYNTTIGVGALDDSSWEIADYSNYGVNSDVMAPGSALAADIGGGYSYRSGTSMATPMVAAAVALYKAQDPYADFETIKDHLLAAGKDLGDAGEDYFYGYGALDMNAFLCEDKGTITYDYCTEEIASTSQTFVRQHTIQTVPEPERSKLVFDDWYYDKAYTKVFNYDAWYTTDFVEDVTLYAKWVNEDDEDASVYNYTTLADGTIEIASYKGKRRYLTIPDTIDGKTVSSIGSYAFSGNQRLREVVFPEHLETIKENAFRNASSIRKITFEGKSLKEIGNWSFDSCFSLRTVSLPDSVKKVGDRAFYDCIALVTVNISKNSELSIIGKEAFSHTAISYFYIPRNIMAGGFDGSVLAYCNKIRGVEVHPENNAFKVVNHTVVSKDGTQLIYYPAAIGGTYNIPDTVKIVGTYAFAGSSISDIELNVVENIEPYAFASTKKLDQVLLPETLTQLGEAAFASSGIGKLILGGNLDSIPSSAFMGTNLRSVHIGTKVRKICASVFASCSSLVKITFDENSQLEVIERGAFSRCSSLKEFVLPDSLNAIEENAFNECTSLSEVIIPKNVDYIGKGCFQYCTNLKKVSFVEESILKKVEEYSFANCTSLQEVKFSANIETLNSYAFSNCTMLSTLVFPEQSVLETIGDYCFSGNINLKSMQLPYGVENIGAFAYVFSGLEKAEITKNISTIGDGAFGACISLKEFVVEGENQTYTSSGNALFDKNIQTVYCVSAAITGSYTLPDSIQTVAPYAFYYDKSLNGVLFPESLQDIQHDAFYYCSNLSNVSIPSSVTNIGRKAFENCHRLTSVSFDENSRLQRLGIYTFVNCGISEITIPASVEEMAQYVFYNCGNLKKVTFEKNSKLTYVSAYVFADTNIEQIIFEEGSALTDLQAHAFEGAYQLKSIDFGDVKLETIDNYAFYDCDKLQGILLPDTVSYIGRYAFYHCAAMNRIDIPASMNYIGMSAFYGTDNIKVYFAGETLPVNLQEGWDNGIAGYFLHAKEYVSNDEWEYTITGDNTISLVRYKGNQTELNLETVDGYTVGEIGSQCFYDNESLTKVTIGSHVKGIGNYAFYGCDGIANLEIPASVENIGDYAFADSKIMVTLSSESVLKTIGSYAFNNNATEAITLPDSVEKIGEGAFYQSSLVTCEIGKNSSLKTIGSQAFCETSIQSIYLPEQLAVVGVEAFKDTSALTSIEIANGNTSLKLSNSAFEGSGFSQITLPERVNYIGEFTFAGCQNLENIYVNEKSKSYTALDGVLCNSSVTMLIQYPCGRSGAYEVPQTITTLTYGAFKDAKKLTEVSFATDSTVRTIGWKAFSGCENLTKISIPDNVVSFDIYAFENCTSLTDVILSADSQLTGVYEGAFYNCTSLCNIALPDTVEEIGEYAFYNCTSLPVVPMAETSQVKSIYDYAFYGCIGINAIPHFSQLTEIGEYSFAKTSVSEYMVPASVKQIATTAFSECENLLKIECDETNEAYTSIDGILYEKGVSNPSDMGAVVIWPFGKKIVLGEGKTELTQEDTEMFALEGSGEVPFKIADSVTTIGDSAFKDRMGLVHIEIPSTVSSIDQDAFSGCSNLKEIILNEGLIKIGKNAFNFCVGLKNIVIPKSVESIGDNAFMSCYGMQVIVVIGNELPKGEGNTIGHEWYKGFTVIFSESADGLEFGKTSKGFTYVIDSNNEATILEYNGKDANPKIPSQINHKPVVTIAGNAFKNRGDLVSISIPKSITEIGQNAFYNCTGLERLIIPGNVKSIGVEAFYDCKNLQTVILEEGVENIGRQAFHSCYKLSYISIPKSVTKMDSGIFSYCNKLKTVGPVGGAYNIEFGWEESIPARAFYNCTDIESVVIPNGIKRVGRFAFEYASGIKRITIPESVTDIDVGALRGISVKTAGPLGGGYDYEFGWKNFIPDYAFDYCDKLNSIYIPQGITYMKKNSNKNLLFFNVDINNEMYSSVDGVLFNKEKTRLIAYPSGRTGAYTIPNGVISVDNGAFWNSGNLSSIYIPEEVVDMGRYPFWSCTKLKSLYICSPQIVQDFSNPFNGSKYYGDTSIILPSTITNINPYIIENFGQAEKIIDNNITYTAYSNHVHEWQLESISESVECQKDGGEIYLCDKCAVRNTKVIPAHDLGEWTVSKEASCIESGEKVRKCSRCDYSETEEIEATGHDYEAVITAPTCTEKGYTTYTCKVCGDSYVAEEVEALGHDLGEWTVSKEASCIESGEKVRKCSRCDYSETEEIEATGHDYEAVVTDPTCTEKGYTTYNCKVCGDSYVTEEVEALGHDLGEWTVSKEASCTEVGEKVRKCSRCDYSESEEIEAAGHTYEAVVTAPTCTEAGYTTYTCKNCGDSYVADEVEVLGHDLGEWTVSKEASCTEAGEKVRKCSRCDYSETEEIEATGHAYEAVMTAPTCTEKGYTTYTCKVCGDSYVAEEIEALGHDFGEWTVSKEASCTEAGEKVRKCSRCDYSETEEIEALGHDYEAVVTDPTCTEKGYTTYTCKNCGDSYVADEVEALGHDLGEWTVSKEASCTEVGEKVRKCSRCDYSEKEEIEATGHAYEAVMTAPTCTEKGYTTYTCKVCGDTYVVDEVKALGHDLGEWTVSKEASCTEAGEKVRKCSRCDYSESEEIKATGHAYEAVITAPTCTEKGYTTYTCKNCGDSYVADEVEVLGHDLGEWTVSKEASCTESGEKVRKCSRCAYSETEEIEATGHDYEAVVTDPTCTEKGYTTYTCKVCGDSYVSEEVEALGHDLGEWTVSKEASCIEAGEKVRKCSRCDYSETEEIEAIGHDYEAVMTAPTCTEAGYTTYTCKVCGDTYVVDEVKALGHDLGEWTVSKEASCTEAGEKVRKCSRCDYSESEEIKATGHAYEAVITAPT
ncbi:leucine-rich repeat protein, partial [Eubacterium ramulus]